MNIRVFAILFIIIFLVGACPMLLVQPSGAVSAGLAAGFGVPMENIYHIAILVGIGLFAAWLGGEAVIILPMSALLMLTIGAMMQIDDHQFQAVRAFMVGAIILFALSVSMLRNRAFLLAIPPIAAWIYFVGNGYMVNIPVVTTPLCFLVGIIINAALMLAIGVSMGVTVTENVQTSVDKLRTMPSVSSFLSFF